MDQRANTSADLAEVLRLQHAHGAAMATALAEQQQLAADYMDKKWASINALAAAAAAATPDTPASSVKWLEHEIRRLTQKMKMKHKQSDADQKALAATRASHETRLKRVQYAVRKADQLTQIEADLAAQAAPANEAGADDKLSDLRAQVAVLRDALENPDPTRSQEALDVDADLLDRHTAEIDTLEAAFAAKHQLDTRDHHVARSVLPAHLKKPLPTPYSLDGVSVLWADMQDALYAAGAWPDAIAHETLPTNAVRNATAFLSADEFAIEHRNEVSAILVALGKGPVGETEEEKTHLYDQLAAAPEPAPEKKKTGVLGLLGKANPFRAASA